MDPNNENKPSAAAAPIQARMNPEVKREWLEALRSGDYVQGDGMLKMTTVDGTDPRFCCMGVLCELAVKHGVIAAAEQSIYSQGWSYDNDKAYPTAPVLEWAGLITNPDSNWRSRPLNSRGYYGPPNLVGSESSLTLDNDHGKTFEDIANTIEKEF